MKKAAEIFAARLLCAGHARLLSLHPNPLDHLGQGHFAKELWGPNAGLGIPRQKPTCLTQFAPVSRQNHTCLTQFSPVPHQNHTCLTQIRTCLKKHRTYCTPAVCPPLQRSSTSKARAIPTRPTDNSTFRTSISRIPTAEDQPRALSIACWCILVPTLSQPILSPSHGFPLDSTSRKQPTMSAHPGFPTPPFGSPLARYGGRGMRRRDLLMQSGSC
jgi:hypothetical protein